MRQKLESIGSLLDRYLNNQNDSGLPTVTLQLYESNEPIRLKAEVFSHSGKHMALLVGRPVKTGQRVSILISFNASDGKTGIDKEFNIEASGTVSSSSILDTSGDIFIFQVSVLLKGRYGVVIDKESSRR